jgi:cytochrome P450 family 6
MFQTLYDCQTNLPEKIEAQVKNERPIDIKEVLGCFTTDVIGSCRFGLECDSFKDDDSLFRRHGRKIFTSTIFRRVKGSFCMNYPNLARLLRVRQFPKATSDFFAKVVKDTVEYREKNNHTRKDFLQLLIDLKNNNRDDETFTIDELTAQSFLFFFAGFETVSITLTFTLYELAKNQEIQEKVRDEIETVLVRYDGKLTYNSIQEMKYVHQILNGTTRTAVSSNLFIFRYYRSFTEVPSGSVFIKRMCQNLQSTKHECNNQERAQSHGTDFGDSSRRTVLS